MTCKVIGSLTNVLMNVHRSMMNVVKEKEN